MPIATKVLFLLLKCLRNSVDPEQTAPIGAVCSGSTLFALILNLSVMLDNLLQQTTSADVIFQMHFFLGALRVRCEITLASAWEITKVIVFFNQRIWLSLNFFFYSFFFQRICYQFRLYTAIFSNRPIPKMLKNPLVIIRSLKIYN